MRGLFTKSEAIIEKRIESLNLKCRVKIDIKGAIAQGGILRTMIGIALPAGATLAATGYRGQQWPHSSNLQSQLQNHKRLHQQKTNNRSQEIAVEPIIYSPAHTSEFNILKTKSVILKAASCIAFALSLKAQAEVDYGYMYPPVLPNE
ncbi:hypothetical protein [Pseudomonas sp. DWP1b1]|uniref:hypothetical protein n=1 Tax=unclassified Pseudomonas TaxID=196821 RepID=UPI003CF14CED